MMILYSIYMSVVFAFAHAYMGNTLPDKILGLSIYPPKGRDYVAYLLMSLSLLPVLGIWSLAAFPCVAFLFCHSPAKYNPFGEKSAYWFPIGSIKTRLLIFSLLFMRYLWPIPPLTAVFYLANGIYGLYTLAIFPLSISLGYLIISYVSKPKFGDGFGKLLGGAILGITLGVFYA